MEVNTFIDHNDNIHTPEQHYLDLAKKDDKIRHLTNHINELKSDIKNLEHEIKLHICENLSILQSHKEIINTIQAAETHRQKGIVAMAYLKSLDEKIKKTYHKLIDKCSPLPF